MGSCGLFAQPWMRRYSSGGGTARSSSCGGDVDRMLALDAQEAASPPANPPTSGASLPLRPALRKAAFISLPPQHKSICRLKTRPVLSVTLCAIPQLIHVFIQVCERQTLRWKALTIITYAITVPVSPHAGVALSLHYLQTQ